MERRRCACSRPLQKTHHSQAGGRPWRPVWATIPEKTQRALAPGGGEGKGCLRSTSDYTPGPYIAVISHFSGSPS